MMIIYLMNKKLIQNNNMLIFLNSIMSRNPDVNE